MNEQQEFRLTVILTRHTKPTPNSNSVSRNVLDLRLSLNLTDVEGEEYAKVIMTKIKESVEVEKS